ncbi:MAG: hypothetical protein HYS13_24175 [Planctomycetia bacterium]|nr:hypothetical protein [Planctomycetia bacterium]
MSQDDRTIKNENARLSFEQNCDMARHYGNLRFAQFTVFSAILGGLLAVELGEIGAIPNGEMVRWFRIGSLFLTVLFMVGEWRVADLVVIYQEEASRFERHSPSLRLALPKGHSWFKWIVRFVMLAPFALAVVLWIINLILWPMQRIAG